MGHMRHHAILVTTYEDEYATRAHEEAERIFSRQNTRDPMRPDGSLVSPLVASPENGYLSFAIFPDGSTERWEPSNWMDDRRAEFVEWLRRQYYSDGSSCYDWVEVQYGDDYRKTAIVGSSDADQESRNWDREAHIMVAELDG